MYDADAFEKRLERLAKEIWTNGEFLHARRAPSQPLVWVVCFRNGRGVDFGIDIDNLAQDDGEAKDLLARLSVSRCNLCAEPAKKYLAKGTP